MKYIIRESCICMSLYMQDFSIFPFRDKKSMLLKYLKFCLYGGGIKKILSLCLEDYMSSIDSPKYST